MPRARDREEGVVEAKDGKGIGAERRSVASGQAGSGALASKPGLMAATRKSPKRQPARRQAARRGGRSSARTRSRRGRGRGSSGLLEGLVPRLPALTQNQRDVLGPGPG